MAATHCCDFGIRGRRLALRIAVKLSGTLSLILGCLLAPFAMAQSASPDRGLLITRINSERWQIRLMSGATAEHVSGVISSHLPITAVRGITLSATDNAKLLTASSLGAMLAAAPGGVDGVEFSASAGAKLCLRDAVSCGVHLYLGTRLTDAVQVTAPVALSSVDACGDANAPIVCGAVVDFISCVCGGARKTPLSNFPDRSLL
jgi:hypothetical protein